MKNVPSLPYPAAQAGLLLTGLPSGLPVPTCPRNLCSLPCQPACAPAES